MNNQNINPESTNQKAKQEDNKKTGLDKWNDRLDENLEPENNSDELADQKSKDYSEREGSGDQSDENRS